MVELLKQPQYQPVIVEQQVALIYMGVNGFLDEVAPEKIVGLKTEFISYLESNHAETLKEIAEKKTLDDDLKKALDKICGDFVKMHKTE